MKCVVKRKSQQFLLPLKIGGLLTLPFFFARFYHRVSHPQMPLCLGRPFSFEPTQSHGRPCCFFVWNYSHDLIDDNVIVFVDLMLGNLQTPYCNVVHQYGMISTLDKCDNKQLSSGIHSCTNQIENRELLLLGVVVKSFLI